VRIGRAAATTDTGRRRRANEDAYVFRPPLFAVADGMGGARAGEIAAQLAAAALEEVGTDTKGEEGIVAVIEEANRRIWERAVTDPATSGMGTTVTAALVDEAAGQVAIGHVGDSRAYLLRGGSLEQLTTDHSLVAELVQSGVLTPEEAERHPQRSAITRALGTEPSVRVETFTVAAEIGDLFLLCSDGLSAMLDDEEVAAAIDGAEGEPSQAGAALVAAANERGGEDNITVVLFELVEGDPEPPGEAAVHTRTGSDPTGLTPADTTDDVRTHGAGPGGRGAALALVAALVVVGVLAVYWGITR
jgi:PPM family protein phosphatase